MRKFTKLHYLSSYFIFNEKNCVLKSTYTVYFPVRIYHIYGGGIETSNDLEQPPKKMEDYNFFLRAVEFVQL
jgi:hypothetical protein